MMIIDNVFEIEQEVYLKTDPDQAKGIITSIEILPGTRLIYNVSIKSYTHGYYAFQLTAEKDVLITTTN